MAGVRKPRARTYRLRWRGCLVQIVWKPEHFAAGSEFSSDHLEIRLIEPDWMVLPITDTGYRSHFVPTGNIGEVCGAKDFVKAWLDDAADDPTYVKRMADAKQRDLFEE